VERLQSDLLQEKEVLDANSYVDVIRFMLPPGVVDTNDGPYLGMRAMGEMKAFPSDLITRDGDRAAVAFYTTNDFGSHQFQAFEKRFDDLSRSLPPELDARLTGYRTMAYRSIHVITDTLFRSFGVSLLAITIVLAIALRSPVLALLCLIPNALPMLVAIGLAGWLDIPLRVGMAIVFSVGLGLAVDDTIHIIVRFRQVKSANPLATVQEHLDESLRSSGFAVVLTSIVLLIAASTFLRSDFSTIRETGVVLGVITIAALISDLLVFPWIIERAAGLKAFRIRTPVRAATPATTPS
jgi:predicted RND superfamily exporter protein